MDLHANAALSLKGRRGLCREVVERRRTLTQAAEAAGVSVRWARKWVGRYRAEGERGLRDRSSAPHRVPHRTGEQRVAAIAALRRVRFTGPEIAEVLDMPLLTVSGILTRTGMGKLGRLGLEPAVRYERERPGELVHIDIKRLGRIQHGAGWRFIGPAARSKRPTRKDPSESSARPRAGRACRSQLMTALGWPTPRCWPIRAGLVIGFLRRAVAFYARHGITVERVLTDNGGAYRSTIHAAACRTLGIRHLRTRAYRPQTNGKAERFIRTLLGGWALRRDLPLERRAHRRA
jgi:transposase InsO family protein